MTDPLAEIWPVLSAGAWHAMLVFLRTGAIVALLPAFGERSVPIRIKLALAVAFTIIVAPAAPTLPAPPDLAEFVRLALIETAIGTAVGMTLRLFVLALQTAGSIAAQTTSLAQLIGGAAAEPLPAMGYVLVVSGLALAMTFGLHVRAAHLILASYQLFPAGLAPDAAVLSQWGLARVAACFRLAFSLAAPFVIASVIYNLTLGVINRAMQQLMVAFVGAPFTTFGGLALLLLAAPAMLTGWHAAMAAFMANPATLSP